MQATKTPNPICINGIDTNGMNRFTTFEIKIVASMINT
ncbi:hypothetical protein X559_0481 [Paenilisteria newyorkensis]|nr:hypothetical protein X559_0481 [Listeria newyorkensis]